MLICLLGCTVVPAALAHHSFSAEFDANKPVKMTGTVTSVEWRNPHVWFYVDVKDAGGNVANWGFELASPNLLLRRLDGLVDESRRRRGGRGLSSEERHEPRERARRDADRDWKGTIHGLEQRE